MNAIEVLDIFQTSWGETAILKFPEKEYPKTGDDIKRTDGASWKIIGTTWRGKLPDETERYKNVDLLFHIFGCTIKAHSSEFILKVGDLLSR
jgi:hypothetical protein